MGKRQVKEDLKLLKEDVKSLKATKTKVKLEVQSKAVDFYNDMVTVYKSIPGRKRELLEQNGLHPECSDLSKITAIPKLSEQIKVLDKLRLLLVKTMPLVAGSV